MLQAAGGIFFLWCLQFKLYCRLLQTVSYYHDTILRNPGHLAWYHLFQRPYIYTNVPACTVGCVSCILGCGSRTLGCVCHAYCTSSPSQHDQPGTSCAPGGSAGNFIMFASATDCTRPNNNRFSECSARDMGATIESNGGCFIPRKSN